MNQIAVMDVDRNSVKPIAVADMQVLRRFYCSLCHPLADINEFMMVAWRNPLQLRFLIEKDVLVVFAEWEGSTVLWGPPLGENLQLADVRWAISLQEEINGGRNGPAIMYLWEEYPLWRELKECSEFRIIEQAREYHYRPHDLASLGGSRFKSKRQEKSRFVRDCRPEVLPYTTGLAPQCLGLLHRWADAKRGRVSADYQAKFELERQVCEGVFVDRLPLQGVVVRLQGEVEAFSLGAPHGGRAFNCMFEKTNHGHPGLSTFVFSELARQQIGLCDEINAGEDWGVSYLAHSKRAWNPHCTPSSYILFRND